MIFVSINSSFSTPQINSTTNLKSFPVSNQSNKLLFLILDDPLLNRSLEFRSYSEINTIILETTTKIM